MGVDSLAGDAIDRLAADEGFTGVIRIDIGERTIERGFGLANRALGIANTPETIFATASGTKGFTALVVMSMVEQGALALDTAARAVLGRDLPLIDERVTVEHLLTHRSGIGDYLDETVVSVDDYVLTVPAHELVTTEQYLRVLDGHPMKHAPGECFDYCNGGFVVLALIAERVSGVPFHDLVEQRICRPAGMVDTAFLRSDELPARVALGYLSEEGLRTNVFHLPVRGNGDGGIYTTAADMVSFWWALSAGRIVTPSTWELMTTATTRDASDSLHYGLGFWLSPDGDFVSVHGFDAGVGFVSARRRDGYCTYTVLGNKSRGAWPVSEGLVELTEQLAEQLAEKPAGGH
jgi:CubicO group peptidase (beta-lactamase class C family)